MKWNKYSDFCPSVRTDPWLGCGFHSVFQLNEEGVEVASFLVLGFHEEMLYEAGVAMEGNAFVLLADGLEDVIRR